MVPSVADAAGLGTTLSSKAVVHRKKTSHVSSSGEGSISFYFCKLVADT